MSYRAEWVKGKVTKLENGEETWTETKDDLQTLFTRTITTSDSTAARYQCYCCTCGARDEEQGGNYYQGSDPACRNHGYAGLRPCDIHNLPGSTWDTEFTGDKEEVMPMAVQQYRDAVKAGEKTW